MLHRDFDGRRRELLDARRERYDAIAAHCEDFFTNPRALERMP